MKTPLHILHLEDDANDAALVRVTLEAEDIACAVVRVENRVDFVAALERGGIDLILSDYSLPVFDGLSAAKIVKERWPALPFIIVSGTLGEERAIDALKAGATDYVLKGRLARLVPAVRRAMLEVAAQAERLRLEAQFIEGQKMDVIGQLAGGVAHDFNNILAVIIGCNDMMAIKLGEDSPLRKYTEDIRHASERAVGLTRQLLVFIRKETVHPVVLDLNAVIKDVDKMLRRLIDANIEMKIEPGKATGCVKADSGYMGQVLMNLVVNARDAMPNGGKLTIATNNVVLDEIHARSYPGALPGEHVMLSVSDTGSGMTDEVKAHLFEAFFTTKPPGKGTGLGLATCQTIVQKCGGHIEVESELGKGTTFKIYFPRVKPPRSQTRRPFPARTLPRGHETLLVVEDDPSVRHLACTILEAQGYSVLTAANGRDALQLVSTQADPPISLVVTDVTMPFMGGKVMAERLKATHPYLKTLFTTGYADDAMTRQGVLDSSVMYLPKPYTPALLAGKVREMLDATTTSA
jgi:two-component system, cell cycle sensor histidine kinase and response regulator CckA